MSYLINVPIKKRKLILLIGFLLLFVLILGCSHQNYSRQTDDPYYRELTLFRKAGELIDAGNYTQAHDLYRQFLKKYPKHPYTDDAAYRIAYLHVIADEANPYYDYQKARVLFQNFIENYQNSHYITACKNWISLLELSQDDSKITVKSMDTDTGQARAKLMLEIERLREENKKLRQDLEQLQKALER